MRERKGRKRPSTTSGRPSKNPSFNPKNIEPGIFTTPELDVEAIQAIQEGMLKAFKAGKGGEHGKDGSYKLYIFILIVFSYILASIIIFFGDKFNLPPEIKQAAWGYIISIPASAASIFIGQK